MLCGNVIEANIRAALSEFPGSRVYNAERVIVALNELIILISQVLRVRGIEAHSSIKHGPERKGDVRHSRADISRISEELDYRANVKVLEGLQKTIDYYVEP